METRMKRFKIIDEPNFSDEVYVELWGATYEELDDLLPEQFDFVGEDPDVDPVWVSEMTLEATHEFLVAAGFEEI